MTLSFAAVTPPVFPRLSSRTIDQTIGNIHIRNIRQGCYDLVYVISPQCVGDGRGHQAARVEGGVVEGDLLEAPRVGLLLHGLVLGQGLCVHARSAASMILWKRGRASKYLSA